MLAWASSVSPAVVLRAPVMVDTTLHCIERSLLVIATNPFILPSSLGLCKPVYYTSAL